MINEIHQERKTCREAVITIIHKEDADVEEISNYRPIYLLNIDYKIFATILATRLKRVLVKVIHQDQAGFLPKRHIRSNMSHQFPGVL